MHRIPMNIFHIFQKFQKMEPGFQIFHISDPRKSVLGPVDVFACFFMSKNSSICLPYWQFSINSGRCSTKVFPMNLPVNMALALKKNDYNKNRSICKRGIGNIRIFLIELPIELPIDSPWNH